MSSRIIFGRIPDEERKEGEEESKLDALMRNNGELEASLKEMGSVVFINVCQKLVANTKEIAERFLKKHPKQALFRLQFWKSKHNYQVEANRFKGISEELAVSYSCGNTLTDEKVAAYLQFLRAFTATFTSFQKHIQKNKDFEEKLYLDLTPEFGGVIKMLACTINCILFPRDKIDNTHAQQIKNDILSGMAESWVERVEQRINQDLPGLRAVRAGL